MNFKLAAVFLATLIALTACSKASESSSAPPIHAGQPAVAATFTSDDVVKLLNAQRLDLLPKEDQKPWVLNGVTPSVFFVGDPLAKQLTPSEYVHVYVFKDDKEREKGYEDFRLQLSQQIQDFSKNKSNPTASTAIMAYPIVWQNGNAIVIYRHLSEVEKKPAFEDKIGKALAGWDTTYKHEIVGSAGAFDEMKAVELVLKNYPDFPKAGETKKTETATGGPPGAKVSGELKTAVEKSSEPNTYVVALTKVWNITVNGKEAKSFWKYKVTPDKMELVSSEENADIIGLIK